MPVLFIFINYVATLFVVIGVASGHLPMLALLLVPLVVAAQYLVYRATERDREPHGARS
jgi:membrane protein implicated in regulation of membrane protease activity